MMFHYCAHCDYNSPYKNNVTQHQSIKHRTQQEDHPQPLRSEEQLTDWDLMEDSIVVLKIYKLLQRMKNK